MTTFISLHIIPGNGLKKSEEVKTEKQNLVFLGLYFGHIDNRISSMDFCSFLRLFLLYLINCLLELAPILYLYSIPVLTSNITGTALSCRLLCIENKSNLESIA